MAARSSSVFSTSPDITKMTMMQTVSTMLYPLTCVNKHTHEEGALDSPPCLLRLRYQLLLVDNASRTPQCW